MLDVRHASSVVNINGRLWDSAKDINLFSPTKGVFYASPWVGTCHQAMYDTIMAGGTSSAEALGVVSSQAGWSFHITTSLYGVNGGYGISGIANAGINQHEKNNTRYIIIFFLSILFVSCSVSKSIGEYKTEQVVKEKEQRDDIDKEINMWWDEYIGNIFYIGMPKDEFEKIFIMNSALSNKTAPYISKHSDKIYTIIGIYNQKYRVTFEGDSLARFETFTLGKIPPLTWHYEDTSFLLKGYKANGPGFYTSMPEDEFLNKFSTEILSNSKSSYVVIGKNNRKYKVSFNNGFLIGISRE